MAIANTILSYLNEREIPYSVVPHPRTLSTRQTADAAHIPPERVAKAVVLADRRGYLMAVIPGDRPVSIENLAPRLGGQLALALENRIAPVFKDCDLGAIPPIGPAYGMETVLDDSLVGQPEIYFEAGDHEELIRIDGDRFVSLLREARHGQFSH